MSEEIKKITEEELSKIKDFQNKIDGFKNKNQDSPE